MKERTPKQTIAKTRHSRNGPRPAPTSGLLQECRHRVSDHLGRYMADTLERLDDALFARAGKGAQSRYFDAIREVRLKKDTLQERFLEQVAGGFLHGIPRSSDPLRECGTRDQASLVDEEQLEEQLAIARAIGRVRSHCASTLAMLDRRMGLLLEDPELEHWENPVGPEAICNALQAACVLLRTGSGIRPVLYTLFDQFLVAEARVLYRDLNRFLAGNGVLPEPDAPAPGRADAHGGAMISGAIQVGAGSREALPRAEARPRHDPVPRTVIGADPVTGTAILNTLTLLQRGDGSTLDNILASTDALLPADAASGTMNLLAALSRAGVTRNLDESGRETVDCMTRLFDYILGDRNIHEGLRPQFSRLQIPLLKLALLDPEFPASEGHPARRLLDGLAEAARGWSEVRGTHDPVYRRISTTVQRILDEFTEDTGLFAILSRELDAFLADEEERARQRATRSEKIAAGREQIEAARALSREQVRTSLAPGCAQPLVRDFLSGPWKNLLFVISAQQGHDSAEWKTAVQSMDDLIWSVQPKRTREERRQLACMQNDLLQRLRMGMAQLSLPEDEQKRFLSQLVRIHGHSAVATGEPPGPRDESNPAADPGFAGPAVEALLESRQMSMDEINASDPSGSETGTLSDAQLSQVRQLREGQWLELAVGNGRVQRARLSWISPRTGACLFTDRQGLKAALLTPAELAARLRDGHAWVLDSRPLLERAFNALSCPGVPRDRQRD